VKENSNIAVLTSPPSVEASDSAKVKEKQKPSKVVPVEDQTLKFWAKLFAYGIKNAKERARICTLFPFLPEISNQQLQQTYKQFIWNVG